MFLWAASFFPRDQLIALLETIMGSFSIHFDLETYKNPHRFYVAFLAKKKALFLYESFISYFYVRWITKRNVILYLPRTQRFEKHVDVHLSFCDIFLMDKNRTNFLYHRITLYSTHLSSWLNNKMKNHTKFATSNAMDFSDIFAINGEITIAWKTYFTFPPVGK